MTSFLNLWAKPVLSNQNCKIIIKSMPLILQITVNAFELKYHRIIFIFQKALSSFQFRAYVSIAICCCRLPVAGCHSNAHSNKTVIAEKNMVRLNPHTKLIPVQWIWNHLRRIHSDLQYYRAFARSLSVGTAALSSDCWCPLKSNKKKTIYHTRQRVPIT